VAVPLALAGLAGLNVAAFRTSCPDGAAGCGSPGNDAPADFADVTHGLAVVAYEVALVVAMLVIAAGLARARPAAAVLTVVVALVSVVLALQIGGADTGWWQRAWLLVNTGWVIVVVLGMPTRRGPPAGIETPAR
jgi:hypothetical protein